VIRGGGMEQWRVKDLIGKVKSVEGKIGSDIQDETKSTGETGSWFR